MHTDRQTSWIGPSRDGETNQPSGLGTPRAADTAYCDQDRGCTLGHNTPPLPMEWMDLEIDAYNGGIALWGAVPAIYDTTRWPMQRGIHVHARKDVHGPKVIDQTIRGVRLRRNGLPVDGVDVSDREAIYFMISSVFGFTPLNILCSYCGSPHLDEGTDSVTPSTHHR